MNHHLTLQAAGFSKTFNGGGCHVHTKELANGFTLSVCNGQADLVEKNADRVHVNAHLTSNCEVHTLNAWINGRQLKTALFLLEGAAMTLHPDQTT